MDIELDPRHGMTGYPIGMPVEELVPAAVSSGRVVIDDPDLDGPLHHMKVDLTVYLRRSSFATVFGLEDGRTLTWIELHAPRALYGDDDATSGDAELHVTLFGIDVFSTPALDLLDLIETQGHEIDRSEEPERYAVPDLDLSFTRDAGHPVPMAADGEPLFMQSVFVAGKGYFDQPLPDIDVDALLPAPLEYRFEISPPHGLVGFPPGMPLQELVAATTPLGHVRIDDPGQNRPNRYAKLHLIRPTFAAIFACEDGLHLTAVELWAPAETSNDRISVRLNGIDVFATPALEVIDRLTADGYTLDDTDPDHPRFPELAVGFTRTRGHQVPLAPDGRTEYVQAVLVGPPGYYDHPLPPTTLEGGEPWKSRLTRPRATRPRAS
jgi:hypothetical protein